MRQNKLAGLAAIPIIVLGLFYCNEPYTSKKRGYFNIDFPEHRYTQFNIEGVPYTFEYPIYAKIVKDSSFYDNDPESPFWYNIDFPELGGRIFLSYKQIGGRALYKIKQPNGSYKDSFGINVFDRMVNDAVKLTQKNEAVSLSITDSLMKTPNGLTGVFFKVGGNAATAKQFFLSDTVKNFIRGALYFDVTPNVDSLRPVNDFLQKDIEHLINTFRWK